MTNREAKRLALKNIYEIIQASIANRPDARSVACPRWAVHPETGDPLSTEDQSRIEREARAVLAVIATRARRLRSVRSGA